MEHYFNEWLRLNESSIRSSVFAGTADISALFTEDLQYFIWCSALLSWNDRYCSRRRKPVEEVWSEAGRRGYPMQELGEDAYSIDLPGMRFVLRNVKGRRTIQPALHFPDLHPDCARNTSRLDAGRLFELMECFVSQLPELKRLLDDRIFSIRQDMNIDRIVLPLARQEAMKRLSPKGIRFFLEKTARGLVLYANIIKGLWFSCIVDSDSYERVISLVPYAIARPDDVNFIDPSARVVQDWSRRLEAAWRKENNRNSN